MSALNQWNEKISQTYDSFTSQGGSLLTHVYPELAKLKLFTVNQSVLSIGPGQGSLEISLAKDYSAKLTLIEPSAIFVAKFLEQINQLNLQHLVSAIFEDKFEKFHSQQSFDLILAIHSWHYIGLDIKQLEKACSLLSSGGVFSIVQTSEKTFSKPLKDLLYPEGHFFIDIEELSRFCHQHDLDHELVIVPKIVPFERYVVNDQLTDYAESWLSLMGRLEKDQISEDLRDKAIQTLQQFEHDGNINDDWGVILFNYSNKSG